MKSESAAWAAWNSIKRVAAGRFARFFLLCACGFIYGCGSAVLRSESANELGNALLTGPAVVRVIVADEARRKRHFPEDMNVGEVQALVEQQLAAKGLLAGGNDEAASEVVVEITGARIRSRWVATTFGFMAGTDHIHARTMLFDAGGRKMNHFNVMTSYALGGVVGGATSIRVPWVYEQFAEDVVGALTGAEKVKLVKRREPRPLRSLLPH